MKPEHHLIPAFVTKDRARHYDPAMAAKGWRTAWRKLTVKAGLKGLRGHDPRHSWVTSHAGLEPRNRFWRLRLDICRNE
jgi:hypothetical protein